MLGHFSLMSFLIGFLNERIVLYFRYIKSGIRARIIYILLHMNFFGNLLIAFWSYSLFSYNKTDIFVSASETSLSLQLKSSFLKSKGLVL